MTRCLLLLACVLVSACDQPAPPPAPKPRPTESGYIARVRALPPGQLDGVLFRAIRGGGGQACQGVKQVDPAPPARPGQPHWFVTCTEGSQWSVSLADDGTAFVTGARH